MAQALSFLQVVACLAYLLLFLLPPLQAFSSRGSGQDATKLKDRSEPTLTAKGLKRRIGIIADLDRSSSTNGSLFQRGYLFIKYNATSPKSSIVSVEWDRGPPLAISLFSKRLNSKGRGLEMSELFEFNSKLYTCDDRTGIVYEIPDVAETPNVQPVPWITLLDGNGTGTKGFKCEWACVKDDHLWIGGTGKVWTTSKGEIGDHKPQFIKRISRTGKVEHLDWKDIYERMAAKLGIGFPGYVVHESGGWSDILQHWMFLPRRASKEAYDDKLDEMKGTNFILFATEEFTEITAIPVGEIVASLGFSSFKWIPDTNDCLVIALKTEELKEKMATYVLVFDIYGNIILPETKVEDQKYEGIAFL